MTAATSHLPRLMTPAAFRDFIDSLPAATQAAVQWAPRRIEQIFQEFLRAPLSEESLDRAAVALAVDVLKPLLPLLAGVDSTDVGGVLSDRDARLREDLERLAVLPVSDRAKRAARRTVATAEMIQSLSLAFASLVEEGDARIPTAAVHAWRTFLAEPRTALIHSSDPNLQLLVLSGALLYSIDASPRPSSETIAQAAQAGDQTAYACAKRLAAAAEPLRIPWYYRGNVFDDEWRGFSLWNEPTEVRKPLLISMLERWTGDAEEDSASWAEIVNALNNDSLSSRRRIR